MIDTRMGDRLPDDVLALVMQADRLCHEAAEHLAAADRIENAIDPNPQLAQRLAPPLLAIAHQLAEWLTVEEARCGFGWVHLVLAQVYAQAHDPESDAHFQVAWNILQDYPDDPNALVAARQYARSLLLASNPSKLRENLPLAIGMLENALRMFPQDGELHFHLGFARLKQGDLAAAEREYERARELGLDKIELELDWGMLCLEKKEYARAEEIFRRAAERDPRGLNGLSLVLAEQGRYREALEPLDRFIEKMNLNRAPWLKAVFLARRAELKRLIRIHEPRRRRSKKRS